MTTKSSNLDGQKTGVNIQTEGHTLTPPSSQNGPVDTEPFSSTPPSHHTILQLGNQHLTTLRLSVVWKYR